MSTLPVSPAYTGGNSARPKNVSTIKKIFIGAIGFSTVSALYVKSSAWYHANNAVSDADLPTAYDPAKLKKVWSQYPSIAIERVGTILSTIAPFLFKILWHNYILPVDSAEEKAQLQKDHAVEFRCLLQELGPCFIKFGQMLSIRPDVLPPVVVYELQKLCDSVPAFPTPKAIEVLRAELAVDNIADVYLDLDNHSVPIAAASLGQVYRCRLASDPSQYVAVKVQRPDMIRTVSLDLFLLRKYAEAVDSVKSMVYFLGLAVKRKSYDIQLLDTFANASYVSTTLAMQKCYCHLPALGVTTNMFLYPSSLNWITFMKGRTRNVSPMSSYPALAVTKFISPACTGNTLPAKCLRRSSSTACSWQSPVQQSSSV